MNGMSNAETLFKIEKIPSDNHIRDILDNVHHELIFPVFDTIFEIFKKNGYLDSFRSINRNLLIALDGTLFFIQKNPLQELFCNAPQRRNYYVLSQRNPRVFG